MSSYAQVEDLQVFGLPFEALSTLSTDVQQRHLDAASGFVDSYLNSRFVLPLTKWGAEITQKVIEIAQWKMLSKRGFDPDDPGDREIKDCYDQAIIWLDFIRDGTVTPLVVDSNPTPGKFGGPNTLQSTTSPDSPEAQSGSVSLGRPDGGGGSSIYVGPPRSRGWNAR